MRLFGIANNRNRIPQSVDEPMAPIDLLYWAIYACLKSHAKDIDGAAVLEMGMCIADDKLTMVVPHSCADVALAAAMECYVLKKLNIVWSVDMKWPNFLDSFSVQFKVVPTLVKD